MGSAAPAMIIGIPATNVKFVHFIRHGHAVSNEAYEIQGYSAYREEKWFDAVLTAKGEGQARSVGINSFSSLLDIELVVVSPLSRAILTACICMEQVKDTVASNPNICSTFGPNSKILPRCVISDMCREKIGVNPCDRRRSIDEVKSLYGSKLNAIFPGSFTFEHVSTNEDTAWTPTFREPKEDIKQRATMFMKWLMEQPEKKIAVVTHSSFLFDGIGPSLQQQHSEVFRASGMHLDENSYAMRWYENCDLRSFLLADANSKEPAVPL